MAILSNGKFYGFLCSVKETGRKLANGVKEYVEDFVSGFAGHGWKLWEYVTGKWMLEIDSIRIREQFIVFEMLVSKMRAIIGSLGISQACGKIATVTLSEDGTEYLITLEDETMSFVAHDFMRCQTYTGTKQMFYHVEISAVADDVIHVPVSEFNIDAEGIVINPPKPGNDIVQFGNSQDKTRQSAIYIHADKSGQPAIDIMFDIDSKDWTGKIKTRLGGDLPGGDGARGFYCENGMIKGVDTSGHTVYCIYPNGTAEFGDGSAAFRKDKSGFIAGGAISWIWDETKGKCICTMQDVVLTWDNLSDEVKENLKGKPGKDGSPGRDGIDGSDGVNGADGVSLTYKGEFTSHPANPQNGWCYRNTTDKKCYVYQDNAWYVMTVDGSDGKNGLDGVNGKDGNDGLDIVWKGDSLTPPANPQKNWVYRDTDNGRVYIYNGLAWELMVADGNDGIDGTDGAPGSDGKDGMGVFITYHDGVAEPAKPEGNGTTGGWHTNATSSVIWMSQKVSGSADTGNWGSPIKIKGNDGKPGQDANLLPWIEKWNGYATELGEEYIVTPKMFSGTKTTNSEGKVLLTGIAQGKDCLTAADGTKRTGIFALVDNEIVFELDPISKRYKFIGDIEAIRGVIGGWTISDDGISSDEITQTDGSYSGKNRTVLKKDGTITGNMMNVSLNSGWIRCVLYDNPILEWSRRSLKSHSIFAIPFELRSAILQPSNNPRGGNTVTFTKSIDRANNIILEPSYIDSWSISSVVYYRLPAKLDDFNGVTFRLFNPSSRSGNWKACTAVLIYNINLDDDTNWTNLSGKTSFLGKYTGDALSIPPGKMVVITGVREQTSGGSFGDDRLKWYVEVTA